MRIPLGAAKRLAVAGLAGAMLAAVPLYGPSVVETFKGGTAMAAESSGAAAVSSAAERTITVTGQGKLTIAPDVAYVSFSVFTRGKTANEVQAENAKVFAAVEKVLKEQFKVADADIKTSGFYVQPEYSYSDKGSTLVGYTADHNVSVTYRDLEGIGKLLDAVSKAGVNRVNGISFGTEKSEAYELQAIEKAMANAKTKADTIAKVAGRSVKSVLHVQQGAGGGGQVYVPLAKMESAAADSGYSTSVQPGTLDFTTTVTVTYEM